MTLKELFRRIIADITFDREMNRRESSWKDYFRPFIVPQLCCLSIYRISYFCFKNKLITPAKLLRNINVVLFGIDIQPDADIKGRCFIGHSVGIVIGPHVKIDEGCMIFQGVTITPGKHPGKELSEKDSVTIGKNVCIYAGAKILGNLMVGSNVTIGANAVVLDSVQDDLTVAGMPARPIRNKLQATTTNE